MAIAMLEEVTSDFFFQILLGVDLRCVTKNRYNDDGGGNTYDPVNVGGFKRNRGLLRRSIKRHAGRL